MLSTRAVAMWASFWASLKTQRRFSSMGSTMRLEAARASMGVSPSATASIMARELGLVVEPTMTSTRCSAISLRAFFTAAVVSEASSRTM
jgi:hypothetical protein